VRGVRKAMLVASAKATRAARAVAPPPLIALVPLSPAADAALPLLLAALTANNDGAKAAFLSLSREHAEGRDWMIAVLDAAKVADVIVVLFGACENADSPALEVLAALRAQGLPPIVSVATGAGAADASVKRRRGRELAAESLGEDAELRPLDAGAGAVAIGRIMRKCVGGKIRNIAWRRRYGYMHVEGASFVADVDNDGMPASNSNAESLRTASLSLHGYVRGAGMTAQQLVMITGVGAFKLAKIVSVASGNVLSMRNDDEAEPIESEAEVDTLAGEQTWPPEMNDLAMPDMELTIKRRIPKGFSEYQAAWLPEGQVTEILDEEDVATEKQEVYDSMPLRGDSDQANASGVSDDDDNDVEIKDESEDELDDDEDMEVDADEVSRVRAAAREDASFPDEVDTPIEIAARVRFARYRGLKSLRTSLWDSKEQLPRAYARLFEFADIRATRKRVLAQAEKAATSNDIDAPAGTHVILTLAQVPLEVAAHIVEVVEAGRMPVVASNMLRHENRRSVVHFGLQRVDGEDGGVVKSKDALEMHCGFARFAGRSMFSEQNANSDKHKMERYLVHGRYTVSSFYGPAIFAPAPALLFHPGGSLIATGSALGADPDRIILKRIVLTGYPYKTMKKRTVVKFMFFTPEDIRWFRPVELWTKLGRSGHIVEPLGTHGRMKCMFDAPVLHHDTVCMTLYKRVFPKSIECEGDE
jgi:pre-rRNA-processing protein TSR1